MTRYAIIEQIRTQVYGGIPTDDATITVGLVNQYLGQGIGLAAKQNYKDALQIEGIGYVNGSFYTTFKSIAVTKDERFIWKVTLPELPLGIGRNEGISTLKFKSDKGELSMPCIPFNESQATFIGSMRPIPNKILFKQESKYLYALSTIILSAYTASVTMISGGDSTDLTSEINVPSDYIPVIIEYCKAQLLLERAQPQDLANDGTDIK